MTRPEHHHWRPMVAADLPAMLAVADIVHPRYPEGLAVFAERLTLYPDGCWVLDGSEGALGYIVSHPWAYGEPPRLNSLLGALPILPTTFYLHDIALLPTARRTGAAEPIIARLIAHAAGRGLPNVSLTAVNGSAGFWRRLGFRPVSDPLPTANLRSYDQDAVFMVRENFDPMT